MRSHFFNHAHTHSHLRLHRSPPTTASPTSPTNLRHPATPHPSNPRPSPLSAPEPSLLLTVPSISILPPTPTPTTGSAFAQTLSSSSSVMSTPESRTSTESVRSVQSISNVLAERRRARGRERARGLGAFEEDVELVMEPRGVEMEGAYSVVGIGEVLSGRLEGIQIIKGC